jgi:hypothetical protein
VNQEDLIAKADTSLTSRATPTSGKVLDSPDLSQMFGIEIADADATIVAAPRAPRPRKTRSAPPIVSVPDAATERIPGPKARQPRHATDNRVERPVPPKQAATKARKASRPRTLSAKQRAAIKQQMKHYWAERREKRSR